MLTDLRERLRGVGRLDIMTAVNRRALALLWRAAGAAAGSPRTRSIRRARVLHAVGEDDLNRGQLRPALAAFREAHRITAEQLARAPGRCRAHLRSCAKRILDRLCRLMCARDFRRRAQALAALQGAGRPPAGDRRTAIRAGFGKSGYAEGNLCTIARARQRGDAARIARALHAALARMEQVLRAPARRLDTALDVANRHGWTSPTPGTGWAAGTGSSISAPAARALARDADRARAPATATIGISGCGANSASAGCSWGTAGASKRGSGSPGRRRDGRQCCAGAIRKMQVGALSRLRLPARSGGRGKDDRRKRGGVDLCLT